MMNNKPLRIISCILMICVILTPCIICAASAAESARDIQTNYVYLNSDTGYRGCIIDEDNLFTDTDSFTSPLTALSEYSTVIVWSCSLTTDQQEAQIDEWQDSDYAVDSCILAINLEEGLLNIYTSGAIFRSVKQDKLQEITDDVITYVNTDDYDGCVKTFFDEIYTAITGEAPVWRSDDTKSTESSENTESTENTEIRYQDPDTGYQAMMLDDADLLTDDEEQQLVEEMKPITKYGHIIFWSTNEPASDTEIQAREKRASYYGRQSAGIFAVNMKNRKVVFHADGAMYDAVSASDARSITDNVSGYASSEDYFTCAKEGYRQVYRRLQNLSIAEPMKYTSYVIIALMLAFVIVVGLAFGVFNPLKKTNKKQAKLFGSGMLLASQPSVRKTGSDTRPWVDVVIVILTSFFNGGSGGSSSGGGGGSSSGGGGGGSSSF